LLVIALIVATIVRDWLDLSRFGRAAMTISNLDGLIEQAVENKNAVNHTLGAGATACMKSEMGERDGSSRIHYTCCGLAMKY
jgi:hypothetical protein